MDASRLTAIGGAVSGLPLAPLDPSRAFVHLGEQLAEVNLGLVRVAEPERFAWAGHWFAIVEDDAGERAPVLMFGVPSGALGDGDAMLLARGRIVEGYVIAPLDLERPHGAGAYGSGAVAGSVVALCTAPSAMAACVAHDAVRTIGGVGIEGDRYATGAGTFSSDRRGGQAVTLIAEESIAQARANGAEIDALTCRRNIVTRGIVLEPLIGTTFAIGTAVLRAVRLAEPCAHLERVTEPGVLRAMVHLGGIRADIVEDGEIRIGDAIQPLA